MTVPGLAVDLSAFATGAKVGPYEICNMLGKGSMGVVFRARHEQTGAVVALKTVRLASPQLLSSIRREIQRLKRLSHPGVVHIRADGVYRDFPWYAMDLFECATWEQLGPIEPHQLRELLTRTRRLCEALTYIHGEGVVHRDLKPSNVLLPGMERAVLVDFGLVVGHGGRDGREVLEMAPPMAGTVAYMAPEQLRGELVDARADIFALGCMLYETLTGQLPYHSTIAERLRHGDRPVRPPSQLAPWLPTVLDELLLRMLAPDRRRRLGHASDISSALMSSLFIGLPSERPEERASRDYLYRSSFVGRSGLLADLQSRLSAVIAGSGQQVLIEGESGSGKTRLLTELLRQVTTTEMFVATGECPPQGATISGAVIQASPLQPLRPFLQAVADLCRTQGEQQTQRLFGNHLRVLATIEPSLRGLPGAALQPEIATVPIEAAKHRLLAAMTDTMTALAKRGPLLLLLDDLQWADELTMELLQRLDGETLATAPILIIGTYRTEETTPSLQALAKRPWVTRLSMGRLDEQAVGSLISDMLAVPTAPAELVRFVAEQAAGNPFFITEYLQTAVQETLLRRNRQGEWQLSGSQAEGESTSTWLGRLQQLGLPSTLRAIVARRIQGLGGARSEVVKAASVLGRDFDAELVTSLCQLPESEVADALNELLRQQFIDSVEGGRYRFAHDKLREVAYASLTPVHQQQLHRSAAMAMESRGPRHEDLLALAHHYSKGEVPSKAREYLHQASLQLLGTGAHEQAAPLLVQALAFADTPGHLASPSERAELHRIYADALFGMGNTAQSADHSEQSLALFGVAVPKTPGQVALSLFRQLAEQIYWMRHGSRQQPPDETRAIATASAAQRLSTCYFADSRPQLQLLVTTLLAANLADRAGPLGPRAVPYATLGCMMAFLHLDRLAQRYLERARADTIFRADGPGQASVALMKCALYQATANWSALTACYEEGIAITERCGDPLGDEGLRLLGAGKNLLVGELSSAAEGLERVRRTSSVRRAELNFGWASMMLGLHKLWTGHLEEARELCRAALQSMASDQGNGRANALAVLAAVSFQQGNHSQAQKEAEESLEILCRRPILFQMWLACDVLPDTLLGLLLHARTHHIAQEVTIHRLAKLACAKARGMSWIAPIGSPLSLRSTGTLLRIEGHPRRAKTLLDKAVRSAQQKQMPIAEAAALVELAQLEPHDSPVRSELLTRAEAQASAVGCEYWAERARSARNQ